VGSVRGSGLTLPVHDVHDHTGVPGVGGGGGLPAGCILLWSGSVASIPSGWALCDGASGTPDLRDRFVVGADAGTAGASGGTVSPAAALPGHAAHAVTQPAGHAAHAVTQPDAHGDVRNHTHPVTDPGHLHDEYRNSATAGGLDGWAAGDASTNTPLLTGYDTGSKVTGVTTENPAAGVASQPHAGAAVDAHSAHAGAAVDAHSAHAGAAVDAHSAHALATWFALAYIMKL